MVQSLDANAAATISERCPNPQRAIWTAWGGEEFAGDLEVQRVMGVKQACNGVNHHHARVRG